MREGYTGEKGMEKPISIVRVLYTARCGGLDTSDERRRFSPSQNQPRIIGVHSHVRQERIVVELSTVSRRRSQRRQRTRQVNVDAAAPPLWRALGKIGGWLQA